MCPTQMLGEEGEVRGEQWKCLRGVSGGKETRVNISESKARCQLLVFFPFDWEPESEELLTAFSDLHQSFLSLNCDIYGVSVDSVASHIQWMKTELKGIKLPLLSDPAGDLATRCLVFDDEERVCLRGFAVCDATGQPIETVVSEVESLELACLALNIVKQVADSQPAKKSTTAFQKPVNEAKISQITEKRDSAKTSNTFISNEHQNKERKSRINTEEESLKPQQRKASSDGRSRSTSFRSLDAVWDQVTGRDMSVEGRGEQKKRNIKAWVPPQVKENANNEFVENQKKRPGKAWIPPPVQEEWPVDAVRQRPRPLKAWGGPKVNICPACGKAVYPLEQVFAADRKPFHKACINCATPGCLNKLTAKTLKRVGGLIVCNWCESQARQKEAKERELMEEDTSISREKRDQTMQQLKDTLVVKR